MSRMKQKGFAHIGVFLIAVFVLTLGYVGFRVYHDRMEKTAVFTKQPDNGSGVEEANQSTKVIWQLRDDGWVATETPPDCSDPLLFQLPSDLEPATMTIWPGQVRGDFKAHGGVRYDNSNGVLDVRAPMDGILYRASSYAPPESATTQYMLDFINNCGIAFRIDHLRVLSPKIEKVLADLGPVDESSATEEVGPVFIEKGELLATGVGFVDIQNYFYDLGVYDLRQKNSPAQDVEWAASHGVEFSHYGICWFDLLSDQENQTLRGLPTGNEGKTSDYC